MRALVTGATGFVGRNLVKELIEPVCLGRSIQRIKNKIGENSHAFAWNPEKETPPEAAFKNVDTVFHLVGEPVAEGRWNAQKKKRIHDSRVIGTRNLVRGLTRLPNPPKVLISASAVGIYGDRADETLEESSELGKDFLAGVCQAWEQEAFQAKSLGIRVITARLGLILGKDGGAFPKLLRPFRLGLGGALGSGTQWMPWIHIEDVVRLFIFCANHETLAGPVNFVAPMPITNYEFTKALGATLRKPVLFPVPAPLLRLAVGEFAEVLLGSQRAVPLVSQQCGFEFKYPKIEDALLPLTE